MLLKIILTIVGLMVLFSVVIILRAIMIAIKLEKQREQLDQPLSQQYYERY